MNIWCLLIGHQWYTHTYDYDEKGCTRHHTRPSDWCPRCGLNKEEVKAEGGRL